jgi:multicomponent Na+:H+ antiporter subunit E
MLLSWLFAGVTFAGLWLVLSGVGDGSSWIIGVPAVIAATWAYRRLSPPPQTTPSVFGASGLVLLFLRESFRGGVDVARRVLGGKVDVEPGLFEYRISLSDTGTRVLFSDMVSLLPGTLSADLRDDLLTVHTLDRRVDSTPDLRRLERHVAAAWGMRLPASARE